MRASNETDVTKLKDQLLQCPDDTLGSALHRAMGDQVDTITVTELLKEIELISQVQSTLAKTLQQTRDQMEACKEAKHRLEMDWSDKYSAQHLGKWRLIYLDVFGYIWIYLDISCS